MAYPHNTSPPTKIFVTHVALTSEYSVDSVRRISRPSIM